MNKKCDSHHIYHLCSHRSSYRGVAHLIKCTAISRIFCQLCRSLHHFFCRWSWRNLQLSSLPDLWWSGWIVCEKSYLYQSQLEIVLMFGLGFDNNKNNWIVTSLLQPRKQYFVLTEHYLYFHMIFFIDVTVEVHRRFHKAVFKMI